MGKRRAGKQNRTKKQGDRLPDDNRKRDPVGLRIVGGTFRGRRLQYGGDFGVRPMKDRTREAVFNLIGPTIRGTAAIDLFAGTGAMALESLSRGSDYAILVERHLPTAKIIRENIEILKIDDRCRVVVSDTFHWLKMKPELPDTRWMVFVCPPYRLFVEQKEQMVSIISELMEQAPADSIFVVESDENFDFSDLPDTESWKRRTYPPAEIGVWYKP